MISYIMEFLYLYAYLLTESYWDTFHDINKNDN